MRRACIVAGLLAGGLAGCSLAGCSSTEGPGSSGLSQTFEPGNYRRSSDTNGTQNRPDVNRAFTQPTLPSIANRGN